MKEFTLEASGTTDAHGFEYHWVFGGAAATGGTYGVVTTDDGDYEVLVYAVDAAGNSSTTNAVGWTLDATAPTEPQVTGLPGALTNVKEFTLTASGSTDAHGFTYRWMFGDDAATGESYGVVTSDDGDYAVLVYAVDAAGNSSTTNTVGWTLDATKPTKPVFIIQPDEFTHEKGFIVTVSADDMLSGIAGYFWSFNGGAFDAGKATFAGEVDEERVCRVRVYAADNAGNVSETNECSWTYDVTPPDMPVFDVKPDEFTNVSGYSLEVSSSDNVSGISGYYWSLNGNEFVSRGDAFEGSVPVDGTNTVRVYARDGAGNVSTTNSWRWIYDATKPTVKLSTETPEYFNQASAPMEVTVEFSETVTNFTAESVYVTNKTDVVVAPLGVATNIYTVTITPSGDGEVSVQILADVVADYAGNGNDASEPLVCIYDTTSPTVTLTRSGVPELLNLDAMPFTVTATFSESVTNFTTESVTVENGTVQEVTVSQDPETTNQVYYLTINYESEDVTNICVQIKGGEVADLAGNPNVASEVLECACDVKRPEISVVKKPNGDDAVQISTDRFVVTIEFSEPVTNYMANTDFAAGSVDVQNGVVEVNPRPVANQYSVKVTPDSDAEPVTMQILENAVTDLAGNGNVASKKLIFTYDGSKWSYEYEKPPVSDIEFGGGVTLHVDSDTGVTNVVSFTSVEFKPGEDCTLTMSGFTATEGAHSGLQMWFVVKDTLDGEMDRVQADTKANFESGELTVTLPADKTVGKNSFFIFGIDNFGPDNKGE